MHIRTATKKDIPALVKLYSQFYRYNALLQPDDYVAVKETGDYLTWIFDQPLHTLFLAESGEYIVGFIHLAISQTPNYPSLAAHTFGQIIDLFIMENYRRKGIGEKLMSTAKQWMISKDLDYLELQVLANNSQAIDFYEELDFSPASLTLKSKNVSPYHTIE